ncbi:hypothetical protein ASPWEDRAFT_32718 [Aspergillus wentii DTO 134E9]|uniref:Fucose-specific lectin n=1 Tax=Aspergillus wentii DTO 134E9 TaxID=1073089 RepID=A0A1L9R6L1_ASPWE|nr:uncharacterized protein ASPWEDRAFT_32718 [Aspergillus wentii DTO 134E9]OJJ30550.1 hypothetical protein ASPWEDRAFT_32718 [Aspergillus wentii DTO 134E9]
MTKIATDADFSLTMTQREEHLIYFQEESGAIREVIVVGDKATLTPTPVATDAKNGTPITSFSGSARIHVFYINTKDQLQELIRDADGSPWESLPPSFSPEKNDLSVGLKICGYCVDEIDGT